MQKNKVVIITWTSSGIGFVLAEYLGGKQYKVYGLSRKAVENKYFKSIIADNAAVQKAISQIFESEKRVDILVNNAGMGIVVQLKTPHRKIF